jgi:hypothetical protein
MGNGGNSPSGQMNPNGNPSGQSRPMTAEEQRQYQREMALRQRTADSLRNDLRKQGVNTQELDNAIANMKKLEEGGIKDDPKTREALEASLVEGLKQFEFSLFRQFGVGSAKQPATGMQADVPAEYRSLVEEYYRQIAKSKSAPPPPKKQQ